MYLRFYIEQINYYKAAIDVFPNSINAKRLKWVYIKCIIIKFFRELNKSALFDLSSSDSTKSHSIILEISAEFANFKSSINDANSFMILVFSIGSFHSSFSLCK